jgi:HD superfamily phosphodiesterase
LDLNLLRASCLLHDIGKYPCILEGSRQHDVRGEQILLEEGFPEVARIIVQHVILRSDREAPIREEHVLYYSDKRVVHDEVVAVEDRFVYLFDTYGKTPNSERGIMMMKEETLRIEREIFLLLDFTPDELVDRLNAGHADLTVSEPAHRS